MNWEKEILMKGMFLEVNEVVDEGGEVDDDDDEWMIVDCRSFILIYVLCNLL